MHKIFMYRDSKGESQIADYLADLAKKSDKDSRIKLNKIRDYLKLLSDYGTQIGAPYVKHLDGEIWELRPLRDRILFVSWCNGAYVLLHTFVKKTQKTPPREIEKAKAELADLIKRGVKYE